MSAKKNTANAWVEGAGDPQATTGRAAGTRNSPRTAPGPGFEQRRRDGSESLTLVVTEPAWHQGATLVTIIEPSIVRDTPGGSHVRGGTGYVLPASPGPPLTRQTVQALLGDRRTRLVRSARLARRVAASSGWHGAHPGGTLGLTTRSSRVPVRGRARRVVAFATPLHTEFALRVRAQARPGRRHAPVGASLEPTMRLVARFREVPSSAS